uniref:DH domain-containing protein n=1 Tax=Strigamia maritima TaxID=126957 RepID=T1IKF7_STRMM
MERTIDVAHLESDEDSDEDIITCYVQECTSDDDGDKVNEKMEKENEVSLNGKTREDNAGQLPSILLTVSSPVHKKMVLEDNLNRLHMLHEGIQKIRKLNLQQTLLQTFRSVSLKRLSSSCPSLVDDDEIENISVKDSEIRGDKDESRDEIKMRSACADVDTCAMKNSSLGACTSSDVKIHINDLTPRGSNERLATGPQSLATALATGCLRHLGNASQSVSNRQSLPQPNLLKLESEEGISNRLRRRSWSSTEQDEQKKIKKSLVKSQRSMSLSSLDSETDETFFDARDEVGEKTEMVAGNDSRWEKQRSLSGSSSPLHMMLTGTECASYHSLNDYGIQIHHLRIMLFIIITSLFGVKKTSHESDQEQSLSKRKKRGGSIFSRKKRGKEKEKEKDSKKTSHQFVSVCYSNSAVCDVCSKSMSNKPALHCETCLVNVHEHSCKDQILDCSRLRIFQKSASKHTLFNNSPLINITRHSSYISSPLVVVSGTGHTASPSLSMRERKVNGLLKSAQIVSSNSSKISSATSKVINEEKEVDNTDETSSMATNITELNSTSMESLDEDAVSTCTDGMDLNDVDDDPSLGLLIDEPEAWSSTIHKKILKKMKDRDIKRQENIYELIITEKHHCMTLKIMQKVFAQGMLKELQITPEMVDKIFPQLDELIEFHMLFLRKLRERQRQNNTIANIGDLVLQQFQGKYGDQMKSVYGHFCSRHKDAVSLYKDFLKSDRKFQSFIKKINQNPGFKGRSIPECILLVTQRVTKYPLLIDALIKSLKDCNKDEHTNLTEANTLVKEILNSVNAQIAEREREQRLLEVYNKIDAKSATIYRGKKFKKSDLLSSNRKLRYEGPIRLNQARGKVLEVTAIVLSDVIFFLQENNQKYAFVTQDNKAGVISLQKLLVREKAGLDSTGIYLISSNPNDPEMYELICPSRKDKKVWIQVIRSAAENCPEEDEGVPSEGEEERKMYEARTAQVRQLEEALRERDMKLAGICEEKMRIFTEMVDVAFKEEIIDTQFKYTQLIEEMQEGPETRELLLTALQEATRLASSLYSEGTNLSRSVSSVGEHQSETYVSPILPKRAETFGGFDNPNKDATNAAPKTSGLKKKFHLLKDSDGRAASLLNLASKPDSKDSSPVDTLDPFLNVKTKEVRRASGPLPSREANSDSPDQSLQSSHRSIFSSALLLTPDLAQDKNYLSVGELRPVADRDTVGELINFASTPPLVTLGKEKWAAAIQLSHYLNTLMCLFSQHFTNVESLRAQLTLAKAQIEKLGKDSSKRLRHNPQLEELRNKTEQLFQERAVWQQEYERQKEDIERERKENLRIQEQITKDQADITNQREQLYRYLEVLQRHGITLGPNMGPNVFGTLSADDRVQTETSPACHRRNASATELFPKDSGRNSPTPTPTPQAKKCGKMDSFKGRTNSAGNVAMNINKRDHFPMNLCSATNQQKAAVQTVRQQLPFKLANLAESSSSSKISSPGTSNSGTPQQKTNAASPPTADPSFLSRSLSEKRPDTKQNRVKDPESNQEIFFF